MKPVRMRIGTNGVVTIPSAIRTMLNISTGEEVDVIIHKGMIVIRKRKDQCVFCGSSKKLTEINGRYCCKACVLELIQ